MELINLEDLNLSTAESRDITEFIAHKKGISTTELLSTIKPNPKHKNNQILTPEKPLKNPERKNNQILTPKNNQSQKIMFNNKERIGIIRKELKELSYKLSKGELKEIKKRLYDIENKKGSLGSKKTRRYLEELDEKVRKLDRYYRDYDDFEYKGIKNMEDFFKLSISEDYYEPTLVKTGYSGNCAKYESKGDKILTVEEYLSLTEPYLAGMINDYKSKGEWKVELTAEINFVSLKPGSDETRVMHTKSDNAEIRIGDDTSDVVKEIFKSLLQRYQENLQENMRGSDFEFDGVNLLYYDFNKISVNRGGSYIESAKWTKDKKLTINRKNNDYKCFQYAETVVLNCDKIDRNPQRVSKIKPFIDQYNWNDIDFPSTSKDWKKFELNNKSIALNILYVPHKTGKIHLTYKSKHNLTCEKQVVLLMITDGEKWHYTAVTRLSGLLRAVTSNNNGNFYCLNCFCSYRTKNKLELHKKVYENRDYCQVEMPNKDNNMIEFSGKDYEKECLLEKISTCYNNSEESSTTEVNKHTPSGYSIFTNC